MGNTPIGSHAIEAFGHGPNRLARAGQTTCHLRSDGGLTTADALDREPDTLAQALGR